MWPYSNDKEPAWEAIELICWYLEDPKSIASCSCVCKSWCTAMSSNRVWSPLVSAHFPCLHAITLNHQSNVSARRLYALASAAEARRLRPPPKPRVCLSDLIFVVTLGNVSSIKPPPMTMTPEQVFAFDVVGFSSGRLNGQRVTWSVAMKGWVGGVVTMVDEEKAANSMVETGWLSPELPGTSCFCRGRRSGLSAEVKIVFSNGGKEVEMVRVGIMDILNWRYITVEDGLAYLQHFLLPPNQTF